MTLACVDCFIMIGSWYSKNKKHKVCHTTGNPYDPHRPPTTSTTIYFTFSPLNLLHLKISHGLVSQINKKKNQVAVGSSRRNRVLRWFNGTSSSRKADGLIPKLAHTMSHCFLYANGQKMMSFCINGLNRFSRVSSKIQSWLH